MSKITYVYNQKTCQYERSRISVRDVLVYAVGLVLMSCVFFAGFVFLYNYVVESDAEKALRAENRAMEQYKPILQQKLASIQATLSELDEKDRALYTELFNTPPPTNDKQSGAISKDKVLLASRSEARNMLEALELKSEKLAEKVNAELSQDMSMTENEVKLLIVSPSLPPIDGITTDQLASGFGDRVNPFHKGTYHHAGVDLAFPRGTQVVAAGHGTVVSVKQSSLQAGYGNYIEINHGQGFVTRYAHLENVTVRPGQKISKGETIGTVGSSGGSIAPHLHYEILLKGEQVNPVLYMIEGVDPGDYSKMLRKSKLQNQSLD